MLCIRTLGASEITIDGARIGAEQPTSFALLFLLAMRGSASSSRREVAALLWPRASDTEQNHRLRSLLHRLRRQGMPLVCSRSTVVLGESASIDFRAFAASPRSIDDARLGLSRIGRVLPDVIMPSLGTLADRLDDERDVIVATVSGWLSAALAVAKRACDWALVGEIAEAYRDIDALNEEAWLTLAEARYLTVGSEHALRTLDEYRARLGESEMPLPALSLWQRIEHRDEAHEACAGDAPFVGRVDVMRRIWSAIASARSSRGVAILLWGPAGIGKTRIIREVERRAAAASVRVLTANAHPIHAVGAQSFMRDLVAFLVSEPGAIGCEPRAYATLRQLANSEAAPDAAHHPAMLFDALIELIAALTDESPLVIMIDDAQWLHESIWPLWRAIFRWSADRRVLWLVGFRAFREEELHCLPDPVGLQRIAVRSLDWESATALVQALLGERSYEREREHLLNTAGGHPMFLVECARAARRSANTGAAIEAIVDDWVSRLPDGTARTLQALAASGGCAAIETLIATTLFTRSELATAVGELERAGIVREENGVLRAFSLWANAALARLGATERRMLAAHGMARDENVIPLAVGARALVRERRGHYATVTRTA